MGNNIASELKKDRRISSIENLKQVGISIDESIALIINS